MPQVDFCFSGYIRGAEIKTVYVLATAETLDVSAKSAEEIKTKLESGEWALSFKDCVDDSTDAEIEMFDYDVRE